MKIWWCIIFCVMPFSKRATATGHLSNDVFQTVNQFLTYDDQAKLSQVCKEYAKMMRYYREHIASSDLEHRNLQDLSMAVKRLPALAVLRQSGWHAQALRTTVIDDMVKGFEKSLKSPEQWLMHGHRVFLAMYLETCAVDWMLTLHADLHELNPQVAYDVREAHQEIVKIIRHVAQRGDGRDVLDVFAHENGDQKRAFFLYMQTWPQVKSFWKQTDAIRSSHTELRANYFDGVLEHFDKDAVHSLFFLFLVEMMSQDHAHMKPISRYDRLFDILHGAGMRHAVMGSMAFVVSLWACGVIPEKDITAYVGGLVVVLWSAFSAWGDDMKSYKPSTISSYYQKIYHAGSPSQSMYGEAAHFLAFESTVVLEIDPVVFSLHVWEEFISQVERRPGAHQWIAPWLKQLKRIRSQTMS